MLMSFASYHLWLPWRDSGLHLARLFVDYEPGIHWSQCQMQSGSTAINTVRVYNPIKQGQDHDLKGEFIRTWLPELRMVPDVYVHEPWKLSLAAQRQAGLQWTIHCPWWSLRLRRGKPSRKFGRSGSALGFLPLPMAFSSVTGRDVQAWHPQARVDDDDGETLLPIIHNS